jgi:hypothetical protein
MLSKVSTALILALAAAAPGFCDVNLNILPLTQAVALGNTITADVQITGVSSVGVGDYDLAVGFDSSVLSAFNVSFHGFLGGPGNSLQSSSISIGTAEFTEVSLLSVADLAVLQPDSFLLGTIQFSALKVGSSNLQFKSITVDDANGLPLTLNSHSASVTVTSVPEPSTTFLLGTTLILLVLSGVRSKRNNVCGEVYYRESRAVKASRSR